MKNFVIGSLIAVAATQVAGCVIQSDNTSNYATVGASWQIKNVSGAPLSPPAGFTTAALFNVAVDSNGTPLAPCTGPESVSGTCFVDLYNFEDHAGVSAPLPPAMYQTWISITDTNGHNAYATSLSAYLDVRDIDLDFNTTIFDNGGYFAVDWDLKAASNSATLSCAQAGATSVQADVTVSGSTSFVDTNPWPCEDQYGVTSVIPVGSYTVSVQALDSAAGYLGKAPEYTTKVIQGPNKVTDLGTAHIVIEGK